MASLYDEGSHTSDTVYLVAHDDHQLTVELGNNGDQQYVLSSGHHLDLELGHSTGTLTLSFDFVESWTATKTAYVALGTAPAQQVPCSFPNLAADSELHITISTPTGQIIGWDPKIHVIPPKRSGT
jgi:hypothetical protein